MAKVDLLKTDYIRKKGIGNPLLTKKSMFNFYFL